MKRPHHSTDLREHALAAVDAGKPTAEIVAWFGVDARTIRRWKQARRERGSVATRPRSGRPPKISAAQHAALGAQVAAHPDATLAQHADLWDAATAVRVSSSTLSRLFAKLRITLKKRP
jgi:transposase